ITMTKTASATSKASLRSESRAPKARSSSASRHRRSKTSTGPHDFDQRTTSRSASCSSRRQVLCERRARLVMIASSLPASSSSIVSGHATIPTNGHETVPTSGHENSPPLAISKACSEAAAKECGCDQAAQSDCGKEQAKGGSGSRTHRGVSAGTKLTHFRRNRIDPPPSERHHRFGQSREVASIQAGRRESEGDLHASRTRPVDSV